MILLPPFQGVFFTRQHTNIVTVCFHITYVLNTIQMFTSLKQNYMLFRAARPFMMQDLALRICLCDLPVFLSMMLTQGLCTWHDLCLEFNFPDVLLAHTFTLYFSVSLSIKSFLKMETNFIRKKSFLNLKFLFCFSYLIFSTMYIYIWHIRLHTICSFCVSSWGAIVYWCYSCYSISDTTLAHSRRS